MNSEGRLNSRVGKVDESRRSAPNPPSGDFIA